MTIVNSLAAKSTFCGFFKKDCSVKNEKEPTFPLSALSFQANINGWSCLPSSASRMVSGIFEKSATSENGFV